MAVARVFGRVDGVEVEMERTQGTSGQCQSPWIRMGNMWWK